MDPYAKDLRYSNFSFPNKVGTYLSAGVPILGLAHSASTLSVLLRRHPVGRITDFTDRGGLDRFLHEILDMADPRAAFREAILQCARTEFSAEAMRSALWNTWVRAEGRRPAATPLK